MSTNKRLAKQGFTLVEILIVVVILGILAAIVIPQFTSAAETAKASSLVSQLQTMRSQLELYRIQHNGLYPTLAQMDNTTADFNNLIIATNVNGAVGTDFGPYLQKAPTNPFTTNSACRADNSGDWQFTAATGKMMAVVPATVFADRVVLGIDGEVISQ